MTRILLRRTGERPLRFTGETLSRTVFHLAENGAITLGLHASTEGGLVCECACQPPESYTQAAGLWPHHAAIRAASAEAAASIFESFSLQSGTNTGAANLVRLAMQACLRAAMREAVGEFLYALAKPAASAQS
jgi:hypothetical protein